MKILEIYSIEKSGYVRCRSCFYVVSDYLNIFYNDYLVMDNEKYHFITGINRLCGEIDSGAWAISYLLSMYNYRPKDFIIGHEPEVLVNGVKMSVRELSRYTCYLDKRYPLFSSNKSVRKLVEKGIRKNKLNCSADDIKNLFELDPDRFERPLSQVGNEVFRSMSAIAYSNEKQVFCFPWLSKKRFDGYHLHMPWLLDKLAELGKIAIIPIGK